MPVSDRTTAARMRARQRLTEMRRAPVTLERAVYLVPGWRDEGGVCWQRMRDWLPKVIANAATHVFVVDFHQRDGGVPPWEDFLDFADDLAEVIHQDVDGTDQEVDLVCHSMGGLDTVGAIALLDDHPEMNAPRPPTPPLACVHTVITFDTPFRGFSSAESPVFKKFVTSDRQDLWVLAQLAAMEKDSKRIGEVEAARDDFLGHVAAFWPCGADNYDGLLEVPDTSARYGERADFAPELRARHRGYRTYSDTTHSGLANGVTNDLRAVLDTVNILATGQP